MRIGIILETKNDFAYCIGYRSGHTTQATFMDSIEKTILLYGLHVVFINNLHGRIFICTFARVAN